MRKLLGLAVVCAMATSGAVAQEPCASFKQFAYSGKTELYGLVCTSQEAAIAAARHYRDQHGAREWLARNKPWLQVWQRPLNRDDIVEYINGVRNEESCSNAREIKNLEIVEMFTRLNKDQFSRTLRTTFWQVKAPGLSGTAVSANYVDLCRF